MGSYMALRSTGQESLFRSVVLQSPSMWLVLAALVLTSSTSMLVNDYYDAKLGRDDVDDKQVPLPVVRSFLNYLYLGALLCVTVLPGVAARFSVMSGLIATFWYTKHIKPMTWYKNVVCAALVALSPLTSAAGSLSTLFANNNGHVLFLLFSAVPDLWRLVAMLFLGMGGREILMDITDVEPDHNAGIITVPVRYGRRKASLVALLCSAASALCAMAGPVLRLTTATSITTPMPQVYRRLALASVGSLMLLYRNWQVYRCEGQDQSKLKDAIEGAQMTLILLLASFL